jgi:hypothetical protein
MTEASHWEIGAVKVSYIVEVSAGFPPGMMFADLTEERVKEVKWLS